MAKPALFDAGAKQARHGNTKALVHLAVDECPVCTRTLDRETIEQDGLLRHGGYGATLRSIRSHCPCGWSLLLEQSEVRPPR